MTTNLTKENMSSYNRKCDDIDVYHRHLTNDDRWIREDVVNMELDIMAKDIVELRSLCRQMKRNLRESESTLFRTREEVRFLKLQNDTLREQLNEYRQDMRRQTSRNVALERENDDLWKTLRKANASKMDQVLDSMADFKSRVMACRL